MGSVDKEGYCGYLYGIALMKGEIQDGEYHTE